MLDFHTSYVYYKLEEVITEIIDRRGVTPLKLGADFTSYGHRVFSAKNIKDGRIDLSVDEPRFVDAVTYSKWMKSPLLSDDVILTSEAPLGEVAYIQNDVDWVLGQRLFTIRSKKDVLHGKYLYYLLQTKNVKDEILNRATGTTVTGIRQSELRLIKIPLPPLPVQRRIANILGALDDKIELNRRMNATLEEMARALFKAWFVDFEPVRAKLDGHWQRGLSLPGLPAYLYDLFPDQLVDSELGEIPQGWDNSELNQIADVIDCLHAKKPERCASGQLFLQLNNILDNGLVDTSDSFFISQQDYQKWISRIEAVEGDCVITNVGRVGAVGQIPQGVKAALGRNITGIRSKVTFPYPTFLIECLVSESMREEIQLKTDSGTILDALNVKSIPKLRFVRPKLEIAAIFEKKARPIRRLMEQNLHLSRTLATLRDTLLPKLLSGEVGVGDIHL